MGPDLGLGNVRRAYRYFIPREAVVSTILPVRRRRGRVGEELKVRYVRICMRNPQDELTRNSTDCLLNKKKAKGAQY